MARIGGSATVGVGLTTILTRTGYKQNGTCVLEVQNTGDQALTAFVAQCQDHPAGEWYTFLSGADWTNPANDNVLFSSGDPTTLAAEGKVHLHFRLNGVYAFRLQASGSSNVSVYGNLSPVLV